MFINIVSYSAISAVIILIMKIIISGLKVFNCICPCDKDEYDYDSTMAVRGPNDLI